ncbi:MAG: sulfurtransferase [Nevskiales bacterium]
MTKMSETKLSSIIAPATLAERLNNPGLLIVDVSAPEEFAAGHIPGAVQIEYSAYVSGSPPVMGLISDPKQLSIALSGIGFTAEKHVVAYDRNGGGQAGRLLYTLDAIGHTAGSLLDGGLQAWAAAELPLETGAANPEPSQYQAQYVGNNAVDKDYILSRLGSDDVAILDCRSPAEYHGQDVRSARGGHIPGAINFNWTDAFDPNKPPSLRDLEELRREFETQGITADKEVIAYCQTHTRSSHTYMLLKQLGFTNVRGYPGAWSDWGNDPETPIEQ